MTHDSSSHAYCKRLRESLSDDESERSSKKTIRGLARKTTQVLIECGLEDSAPSKGIYSQLPNQAALEENRALHKKYFDPGMLEEKVNERFRKLTEKNILDQVNATRKAYKLAPLEDMSVIDKRAYQEAKRTLFCSIRSSVRQEQEMKLFEDFKHLEYLYK